MKPRALQEVSQPQTVTVSCFLKGMFSLKSCECSLRGASIGQEPQFDRLGTSLSNLFGWEYFIFV